MTKYLLTGDGRRLLTGGGQVLTADAPGPAFSDLTAEPMPVSITLAAKVAAVAVATVAPMAMAFGIAASPTANTGIAPMPVTFGLSATPSAWASAEAAPAALEFGVAAAPSATAQILPAPAAATFDLHASPSIAYPATIRPRPMPVQMRLVAKPTRAAVIRPRPLPVRTTLAASISISTAAKWREKWLAVYGLRQTVLNAIDANNRELAKEAGVLAGATATALVQTNTRVDLVDGRVTTEAQRVTVLTGRVGNVEGTQTAQGTAISNLQTTQTSQGNTLTSHSQQLVNVQSSITTLDGKVTVNANATTALDARVSVNEQGVAQAKATWGVYLTAGNVISGVQSINNGIVAEFNVMAHVFRLLSPAGADGMEIQDGYIRIWKGNSQTIIGNRFGVAGQGLMKWFGPNIGAAACTKANATSWEDDQGNAYFGGSLSAGVLRNGAQSTQVGSNAVVETGQFGTNGGAKTVTYSLSYANYFITQSNLGGNGNLTATLILERSIGGGGWVEVSRRSLVGSKTLIEYEAGVGYSYSFSIGGSSTFTDNTGGSASTFNYRVRMEGVTGWPYAKPEGGASPWGTQSLTVLSIEE